MHLYNKLHMCIYIMNDQLKWRLMKCIGDSNIIGSIVIVDFLE